MSTPLDDLPREKLREIVATYDGAVWSDPARCRALLLDLCGEQQQHYITAINMLIEALLANVVTDLLMASQMPPQVLFPRYIQRLQEKGFDENWSRWAVETWAIALGVFSPTESLFELTEDTTEKNPADEWRVLGASVRGDFHKRDDKPNQDAIFWKQGENDGLPLILAIADGHGARKYSRSHIGAQLAVQIAVEEIDALVQKLSFPVTNFVLVRHLFTVELPGNIVTRWQKETREHWHNNAPTTEEWEILSKSGPDTTSEAIESNPSLPYAATLLAILITSSFIFYVQLGDGDIVEVQESGESSKMIKTYADIITNETASLCSTTLDSINDHFRTQFHFLSERNSPPALIMLSSDGYSNSFAREEGFLRAGSDFLHRLRFEGIELVNTNLSEWLTKTGESGSGDDISLGLLFRMSALQVKTVEAPLIPLVWKEETESAPQQEMIQITSAKATNMSERSADVLNDVLNTEEQEEHFVEKKHTESKEQTEQFPLGGQFASSRKKKLRTKIAAGQTLVVSKQGNGQYTTIHEALESAQPKDRIVVEPGIYTESLLITKEITITGQEGRERTIIDNSDVSCLQLKTRRLTRHINIHLEGITFRESGEHYPVIDIIGKCRLTLSNCTVTVKPGATATDSETFTGPSKQAVVLQEDAYLSMKNCSVEYKSNGGILIGEKCYGELSKCQITGDAAMDKIKVQPSLPPAPGLTIMQQSSLTLDTCTLAQGRGNGLLVHDGGQARVLHCHFSYHNQAQIELQRNGKLFLDGGNISHGKKQGILIQNYVVEDVLATDAVIQNCHISRNTLAGIKINKGNGTITISKCVISDGKGSGLLILGNGTGKTQIAHCKMYRNVHAGIEMRGAGELSIRFCEINRGYGWGLLCRENSHALVEDCGISVNDYVGIEIIKSTVEIQKCQINGNRYYGMIINNHGRVTLQGCYHENNGISKWLCSPESAVETVVPNMK